MDQYHPGFSETLLPNSSSCWLRATEINTLSSVWKWWCLPCCPDDDDSSRFVLVRKPRQCSQRITVSRMTKKPTRRAGTTITSVWYSRTTHSLSLLLHSSSMRVNLFTSPAMFNYNQADLQPLSSALHYTTSLALRYSFPEAYMLLLPGLSEATQYRWLPRAAVILTTTFLLTDFPAPDLPSFSFLLLKFLSVFSPERS